MTILSIEENRSFKRSLKKRNEHTIISKTIFKFNASGPIMYVNGTNKTIKLTKKSFLLILEGIIAETFSRIIAKDNIDLNLYLQSFF